MVQLPGIETFDQRAGECEANMNAQNQWMEPAQGRPQLTQLLHQSRNTPSGCHSSFFEHLHIKQKGEHEDNAQQYNFNRAEALQRETFDSDSASSPLIHTPLSFASSDNKPPLSALSITDLAQNSVNLEYGAKLLDNISWVDVRSILVELFGSELDLSSPFPPDDESSKDASSTDTMIAQMSRSTSTSTELGTSLSSDPATPSTSRDQDLHGAPAMSPLQPRRNEEERRRGHRISEITRRKQDLRLLDWMKLINGQELEDLTVTCNYDICKSTTNMKDTPKNKTKLIFIANFICYRVLLCLILKTRKLPGYERLFMWIIELLARKDTEEFAKDKEEEYSKQREKSKGGSMGEAAPSERSAFGDPTPIAESRNASGAAKKKRRQ